MFPFLKRRAMLVAAVAAVATPAAFAQGTPLRMVVPFGPGTTTDIVSRLVGDAMAATLGQTLVVENKAGAGGTIGSDLVAKATAATGGEGGPLLMGTVGTHAINPTLYRKLSYDALRDFAPVGFVGYTPTLLVVASGSPIKSVADLKAAAAKAGGVTFASAGNGTSGHLAGELLGARLGGQMVHVPYSQGGQALTDVIGGQAQFMFYHPAAVLPHMKAGKLRALGASSARRSAAAPEVPTLQEQGVPDFDLVAWFMLYAPASTPERELARLREGFTKAMARPEVVGKLGELGVETRPMAAAEFAAFGQQEIRRWAEAVKRSGAQVD